MPRQPTRSTRGAGSARRKGVSARDASASSVGAMGAAMSANGAKATRQTGGDFAPGAETSVFNEAFTAEVCDALYLKAPRLIKRMRRVPTREIRLAGGKQHGVPEVI